MNLKKAKALRKIAKIAGKDLPLLAYKVVRVGHMRDKEQILLAESVRGVYKQLKRKYAN